jgi:hypothetical protein
MAPVRRQDMNRNNSSMIGVDTTDQGMSISFNFILLLIEIQTVSIKYRFVKIVTSCNPVLDIGDQGYWSHTNYRGQTDVVHVQFLF